MINWLLHSKAARVMSFGGCYLSMIVALIGVPMACCFINYSTGWGVLSITMLTAVFFLAWTIIGQD